MVMPIYNFNKIIERSRERCMNNKIEKSRPFPARIIRGTQLEALQFKNANLIKITRPFMEIIYDVVKGSGFSIYLADKDGIVLSIIGDQDIIEGQEKVGIVVGADMSEESAGTNAIGTALYEDCSIQISGDEHFIRAFYIWTCSAAVIHNENGDILGCLNLTGRCQLAHPHTLGLVIAAVKSIENRLAVEETQKELFNTNQYLNTVMNSMNVGIITTDMNGIIRSLNSKLCEMLDVKEEEIINQHVDNFSEDWSHIGYELSNGKVYENKETIYYGNDKKTRFDLSVYPIKNYSDNIIGTVWVIKDIKNVYDLVHKYTGMSAVYTFDDIIGESKEILELIELAKSVSDSPSTILIQGESGTGKELIAQSIHNNSSRRNKSFVAINCGAIPKGLIESEFFGYEEGAFTGAKRGGHPGKFELANGGTLFLDEIGEMPLDLQVSLLRVLQEGSISRLGGDKCTFVDVRVIASTNKDLKKEIEQGTFREDLYYRLSVIPLYVPSLREREGDIEILIKHFLKMKSEKLGKPIPEINRDLYEKLINYSWPGNIREMENCIENIVNMGGKTSFKFEGAAELENNSNIIKRDLEYNMCTLEEFEKKAISTCLKQCNGNITKAAQILGVNRSTIHLKIKKYQIKNNN
ncbi:MAG TPA: sigma 54-interacting transcriptional regulator [Clostridiales bacterium]|jgi:PAS domain S-box-containing protein|nr:sigma 54-interacting transcriptional regulator [Clostridiales bacterium]